MLSKYCNCRVPCILFGRGGVPPSHLKFSRQHVSSDIIQELTKFLQRDDITRASSCRSMLVDGQKAAARYWQDSIKNVIQQYILQCPNGVKRTYIYTHLPQNFHKYTMLVGLCNLCDDFGHSNLDVMCALAQEIANLTGCSIDHVSLANKLTEHQTFLKRTFSKSVERYSACLELCMRHAFGTCSEVHPDSSGDMLAFYDLCESLSVSLARSCSVIARAKLQEKLKETVNIHWDYVAHLVRTRFKMSIILILLYTLLYTLFSSTS